MNAMQLLVSPILVDPHLVYYMMMIFAAVVEAW